MAKSKSKSTTAASSASTPAKDAKAAASSIDDIFAKPAKTKITPPAASAASSSKSKSKSAAGASHSNGSSAAASSSKVSSSAASEGEAKKKKKKNKVAASFNPPEDDTADAPAPKASSSRVVEVVDPSLPKPQAKVEMPAAAARKGKKRDRKDVEEDEAFMDSRGDGPRRKTEEGFLIYKEAELNIDPEAGGTPLCPFDCECCF